MDVLDFTLRLYVCGELLLLWYIELYLLVIYLYNLSAFQYRLLSIFTFCFFFYSCKVYCCTDYRYANFPYDKFIMLVFFLHFVHFYLYFFTTCSRSFVLFHELILNNSFFFIEIRKLIHFPNTGLLVHCICNFTSNNE